MVQAAVQALRSIGVEAEGGTMEPGVWVRGRKIGAVGIEILGGITRHGLSLNLGGRLEPFDFIVQCGVPGTHATSVDALGLSPPRAIEVGAAFANTLSTLLGLSPQAVDPTTLLG
jgi:lipoate-protein ligase B